MVNVNGPTKAINYLQPREKLRLKGVAALSDRELLQLVIGSGTARIGAAKLARHVLRLFRDSEGLSFQELIALPGLGVAQASRLAAVLELGRRFPQPGYLKIFKNNQELAALIPEDGFDLWLITLDGAGRLIERRLLDRLNGTALIRAICSYMLKDNSVRIIVLKRVDASIPSLGDLSLARNLRLAVRPFEISVDMLLVHGDKCQSIIKEPQNVG